MPLKLVRRTKDGPWYIRGTIRGRRVFETTETVDRAIAEALRAKRETDIFAESILGRRVAVSFQRAAVSYLEFEERSQRTKYDVGRLVELFGATAMLTAFDQSAADRLPTRRQRSILSAILNHAAARGWCPRPAFALPKLPKGKTRWLTPAEALRLIESAAPHLRPLLHFILCTGARMSEALDLDWADVDLAAARVIFRDTKNGTDRCAALPEAAIVTLANLPVPGRDDVAAEAGKADPLQWTEGVPYSEAQANISPANRLYRPSGEAAPSGPRAESRIGTAGVASGPQQRNGRVFRRDDGEPYHDAERQYGGQIKTAWRTACKRAGLADVTPHDLRHTWASYFYALTKDPLLLKAEGGWKSLSLIERYAHLMPSTLVPEIAKVWGRFHPRIGAYSVHQSQAPRETDAASNA
jgi:integrase